MSEPWPIVFLGTPEIAAITLTALLDSGEAVVGVVTQPDKPAGRGQRSVASPVRRAAEVRELPVLAPEKIRDPAFAAELARLAPEIMVVVAYGRILPSSILNLAPLGCVNVHYSLLPKYRGAAPAAWTIINGDDEAGVTTMRLVEKMDAGPIYLHEKIAVAPDDTTASLQAKLTPVGARLLLDTIRGLRNGSLTAIEQDDSRMTLAPMIRKEDGRIDWHEPAAAIERKVRGFTPWPSAYSYYQGKMLKVHRAAVITVPAAGTPGTVLRADAGGFWVSTGSTALSLEEVQLEGKRRLAGADFVRGARIAAGEKL